MQKHLFLKLAVALLSLLLVFSSFGVLAQSGADVDIDVSDEQIRPDEEVITADPVFVNSEGTVVDSTDYYGQVKFTAVGNTIKGECLFDSTDGAYQFLGWYLGEEQVSSNTEYSFTYSGQYPVAKILSKNILTSGASFEGVAAGNVKTPISGNSEGLYSYNASKDTYSLLPSGPAPTGNTFGMFTNFAYATHILQGGEYVAIENLPKGAYNGDNLFPITAIKGSYEHTYYTDYDADQTALSGVTVTPRTGDMMIGIGQMYRSAVKELAGLEKNTAYELSLWVYQAAPCGYIHTLTVADSYDGVATNAAVAFSSDVKVLGTKKISEHNYGGWQRLTVPFTTGDKQTAYLHISQNGKGVSGQYGMIFIDDLTVVKSELNYIYGKELASDDIYKRQSIVTVSGNSAALDYTASGVELTLNCAGPVKASFTSELHVSTASLRLALYVDGQRMPDIVLNSAGSEVLLFNAETKGKHTVRLERMTETQIGRIWLNHISFSGSVAATPDDRELHIDFYGDSITAGWGTTAYDSSVTNPYDYQDGTLTYASVAAKLLSADYNAFGYSGIGVAVTGGADGKGQTTMAYRYPSLPKNTDADYVVVNLGTNDIGKYVQAGLTEQQVKDAYLSFAKAIRADYGEDTPIIFVGGMMTDGADGFIAYAVEGMQALGDKEIYSLKLPHGASGGAGHPNIDEQAAAGRVLAQFITGLGATLAGDVNNDGDVTLTDVVTLAQHVAGWQVEVNEAVANVNGKDSTDLTDVVALAQYVAGWSDIAMTGTVYKTYNPVVHTLAELKDKLKLNGRAAFDGDQLRLEWSASGFELQGQFSGDMTLKDIVVSDQLLAYVVLDGDTENALQLTVNNGDLTILSDIAPGMHTVRFIKANEAAFGNMTVGGIAYNGAIFDAPEPKALKLQVIGDSITSGSGLYKPEAQPVALYRNDITKGYAFKTATHFNADLSVISVSGGSICTKSPLMGEYYQRAFYSRTDAYDFSSAARPDVVVIALGTNDTPTYNTDNVPGDNVNVLQQGIKDMLTLVREKNPDAAIVWAYGMMATNIASVYKSAVEEFAATDKNTYYVLINRNDCNGDGGHPTPEGHSANAAELISFIESNILKD